MRDFGKDMKRARDIIEDIWKGSKKPFSVETKPLYSTITFTWECQQAIKDSNGIPVQMHAVLGAQTRDAFGYGLESTTINGGIPGLDLLVTRELTNLTNARTTPGDVDFAIEGLSAGVMGMRVKWPDAAVASLPPGPVKEMYLGKRHIFDPGSIASPLQCQAPFNLCDPFFYTLRSATTLLLEWNGNRTEHIGTLDMVGGALTDYLHAQAEPSKDSRMNIPEGLVWLHKGNTQGSDSELTLRADVKTGTERVIPIDLPTNFLGVPRTASVFPEYIFVDVRIALHGVSYFQQSVN